MTSVFDLHVHTVKGSSDSSLSPEDLVSEALRLGLNGVCLTEHSGWRDLQEFKAFAARQELVVVHALEVDTVYGHVLGLRGGRLRERLFQRAGAETRRPSRRGLSGDGPRVSEHLQPAAVQPEPGLRGRRRLSQDANGGAGPSPLPPGGRRGGLQRREHRTGERLRLGGRPQPGRAGHWRERRTLDRGHRVVCDRLRRGCSDGGRPPRGAASGGVPSRRRTPSVRTSHSR